MSNFVTRALHLSLKKYVNIIEISWTSAYSIIACKQPVILNTTTAVMLRCLNQNMKYNGSKKMPKSFFDQLIKLIKFVSS